MTMRLTMVCPTELVLEAEVTKVIAEARNGSFCVLPRHRDFVAELVPGILAYVPATAGDEPPTVRYAALDEGVFVKHGRQVTVSSMTAIVSGDLARLDALLARERRERGEEERAARGALARLEAGAIRRFVELEAHRRG